jgi:hypothetical protein
MTPSIRPFHTLVVVSMFCDDIQNSIWVRPRYTPSTHLPHTPVSSCPCSAMTFREAHSNVGIRVVRRACPSTLHPWAHSHPHAHTSTRTQTQRCSRCGSTSAMCDVTLMAVGWSLGSREHAPFVGLHMQHPHTTQHTRRVQIGGNGDGGLHERAPYWLNGIVPLAYLLKNAGVSAPQRYAGIYKVADNSTLEGASDPVSIIDQSNKYVEYILAHQDPTTGWLGPNDNNKDGNIYVSKRHALTHAHTHSPARSPSRTHAHAHAHAHTHAHAHAHAHTRTHAHALTFACTFAYSRTRGRAHTHACTTTTTLLGKATAHRTPNHDHPPSSTLLPSPHATTHSSSGAVPT